MGFSGYCENSRSFGDISAPALLLSSPTPLIQSGLVSPHNEAPDKCAAPLKKWHITNPYLDKKAWNVILHHRAAAAQLRHFTIQTPDNHPQITLQCNTHFYISIHSDTSSFRSKNQHFSPVASKNRKASTTLYPWLSQLWARLGGLWPVTPLHQCRYCRDCVWFCQVFAPLTVIPIADRMLHW